jgi:FkbM family methyltransferase
VHAFEPFPRTFDTLTANLGAAIEDGRAVAVCKGLGERAARLRFNTRHLKSSAYRLQDDGDTEVEVVDIDGHVAAHGLRVSLIKLDVEGGEPEALLGAARTIAAQRPVLHVSLTTGRPTSGSLWSWCSGCGPDRGSTWASTRHTLWIRFSMRHDGGRTEAP